MPYRSSAQSSIDMITGRLDMQFATVAPTLANIREGKLRALATTGTKRVPALPDVPTMIEAGVPGYDVSLWAAYAMPAGTPDEIVAKLNAEMRAILSDAGDGGEFARAGLRPRPRPARRGDQAHPERNREVARAGGEDRHQGGVVPSLAHARVMRPALVPGIQRSVLHRRQRFAVAWPG